MKLRVFPKTCKFDPPTIKRKWVLQDLEGHSKEGLQSLQNQTFVNLIALVNTIFNKMWAYAEFT